jgi:SAM-dependent methyltransferase
VDRAYLHKKEFAGERAPFVHYVQGDIFQPPFPNEFFDHIHSSGVLHHTPSTDEAFIHFAALVRPGGNAFIQLYRKRTGLVNVHHILMRSVTTKIPTKILFPLCYLGAPINLACTRMLSFLRGEPKGDSVSLRERAVVIFDNYSPPYQHRFHPDEVEALFLREGFVNIHDKTLDNERRQSVAFVGTKPKS